MDVINGVIDPDFDPDTFDFDAAWLALSANASAPAAPIKVAGPGETGAVGARRADADERLG